MGHSRCSQVATNFGLIPKVYGTELGDNSQATQWQRFSTHIQSLNDQAGPQTKYKVLFLGRHGEGVHNVAERRYGTQAWDDYWSLLDGDEYGTWVDARLTDLGISQAKTANAAWAQQIEHGIPSPQSYYVSPLNRCLETGRITFEGLSLPDTDPFRPLIQELLRETTGVHTCDRRSKASEIAAQFPLYRFEPDFAEDDPLWDPKKREPDNERNQRLIGLLNDIFGSDDNVFLSLTAHSGAITSILEVTGHRPFPLATGAVIPVVVRAEQIGQGSQARPSGADSAINVLGDRARTDSDLIALMKVVASGRASAEQMEALQRCVDQAEVVQG